MGSSSPAAPGAWPVAGAMVLALVRRSRISEDRAEFIENLGDAYAPFMDSSARTTALVLRGLFAHKKDHPLAARLVRGLLGHR